MKDINKLTGYDYLFHHLSSLYLNNALPNKIILSGKKGIGKFLFSSHFVNSIFSQDEEYKYDLEKLIIDEQNKSYALFKKNIHPNIFLLTKNVIPSNYEI